MDEKCYISLFTKYRLLIVGGKVFCSQCGAYHYYTGWVKNLYTFLFLVVFFFSLAFSIKTKSFSPYFLGGAIYFTLGLLLCKLVGLKRK